MSTLRMDHEKLLDVLMSLSVSQLILPRAVCFATSRPANHAICSFIDSSGYASGPIRRCLFIDYIIKYTDRGSYVSAHVLLNLSNEIKCDACRAFYIFFATSLIYPIIQEHEC